VRHQVVHHLGQELGEEDRKTDSILANMAPPTCPSLPMPFIIPPLIAGDEAKDDDAP
jgi:hypothetical protein